MYGSTIRTSEKLTQRHMHAQKIVHDAHFFVHKTKKVSVYAILRTRISGKTRVTEQMESNFLLAVTTYFGQECISMNAE